MAGSKYTIFEDFCGHGIGVQFHQAPLIQHHLNDDDLIMEPGMVFTIGILFLVFLMIDQEPIFSSGLKEYFMAPDQWTVLSIDQSRSAQFEHTLFIHEHGVDVLTR